jgi:hypothetical protein
MLREKKKWHIDRIERTLETIIKQLESERTQNKSEADRIENVYTAWRNAVLTATSFAASLILGLYSADVWNEEFALQMLAADVIVGMLAFIVTSIIRRKIQGHILSMDTSYFHALNSLNRLALFIADKTVSIDKNDMNKLWWFVLYVRFTEKAVRGKYIDSLQGISRSRFFKKTSFPEKYERVKTSMNEGIAIYRQDPEVFNEFPSDLKVMKNLHQNFFGHFDYTIDETGAIVERAKKKEESS